MAKIIIPGLYGIGTEGFTEIDSGYKDAANLLITKYRNGETIDTHNHEIKRVLDRYNAGTMDELCGKFRR